MAEPHDPYRRLPPQRVVVQHAEPVVVQLNRDQRATAVPILTNVVRHLEHVAQHREQITLKIHVLQTVQGSQSAGLHVGYRVILKMELQQGRQRGEHASLHLGNLIVLQSKLPQRFRLSERSHLQFADVVPIQGQGGQIVAMLEKIARHFLDVVPAQMQLSQLAQRGQTPGVDPPDRVLLKIDHRQARATGERLRGYFQNVVLREEQLLQLGQLREHAAYVMDVIVAEIDRSQPLIRSERVHV